MDKNIAALLREDAKTIRVSFDNNELESSINQMAKAIKQATGAEEVFVVEDSPNVYSEKDTSLSKRPPGFKATATPIKLKTYTYVTNLGVEPGDQVVVEARGNLVVATVVEVDTEVKITPNDDTYYRWVVGVVDSTGYDENMERNRALEETVAKAYKRNIRRSFQNEILLGLEGTEEQAAVKALISGKPMETEYHGETTPPTA